MRAHRIAPKGPFDLNASKGFLCAFTPAAGGAVAGPGPLLLSFLRDRTFEATFARVTQDEGGILIETTAGDDGAAKQVERILSLDHDATGWVDLVAREPVLGAVVQEIGFRPPVFPSPYEAAIWGILAQRIPMTLAARLKRTLAERYGKTHSLMGHTLLALPHPARLLEQDSVEGLPQIKLERLRGVALAALEGKLDADTLKRMPHAAALESLQSIPGVGPWTAQLILTRGTGPCDAVPDSEPRLAEALGRAFELHAPPAPGAIAGLLERFRPYRMWASVALVRHGFSLNRAEAATAGRTARKRGSGRRADASPPRGT